MIRTISRDENEVSDCTCGAGDWFIVHRFGTLLFFGQHVGQITMRLGHIQYTDSELEALRHIADLELETTVELAEELTQRLYELS